MGSLWGDDHDPGEVPDVRTLYAKTQVARYAHTCDGCPMNRSIPARARYGKSVCLVDGEVHVQRMCIGGTCWDEHEAEASRPQAPAWRPNDLQF